MAAVDGIDRGNIEKELQELSREKAQVEARLRELQPPGGRGWGGRRGGRGGRQSFQPYSVRRGGFSGRGSSLRQESPDVGSPNNQRREFSVPTKFTPSRRGTGVPAPSSLDFIRRRVPEHGKWERGADIDKDIERAQKLEQRESNRRSHSRSRSPGKWGQDRRDRDRNRDRTRDRPTSAYSAPQRSSFADTPGKWQRGMSLPDRRESFDSPPNANRNRSRDRGGADREGFRENYRRRDNDDWKTDFSKRGQTSEMFNHAPEERNRQQVSIAHRGRLLARNERETDFREGQMNGRTRGSVLTMVTPSGRRQRSPEMRTVPLEPYNPETAPHRKKRVKSTVVRMDVPVLDAYNSDSETKPKKRRSTITVTNMPLSDDLDTGASSRKRRVGSVIVASGGRTAVSMQPRDIEAEYRQQRQQQEEAAARRQRMAELAEERQRMREEEELRRMEPQKPEVAQVYREKDTKVRNRRVLGNLLGHLASAKKKLEKDNPLFKRQDTKQKQAVERVRTERVRQQDRERNQLRQQREMELQKRDSILAKQRKMELMLLSTAWTSMRRPVRNYIRTKTEPSLCWLPNEHTKKTRALLKICKAEVDDSLRKREENDAKLFEEIESNVKEKAERRQALRDTRERERLERQQAFMEERRQAQGLPPLGIELGDAAPDDENPDDEKKAEESSEESEDENEIELDQAEATEENIDSDGNNKDTGELQKGEGAPVEDSDRYDPDQKEEAEENDRAEGTEEYHGHSDQDKDDDESFQNHETNAGTKKEDEHTSQEDMERENLPNSKEESEDTMSDSNSAKESKHKED